MSVTCLVRVGKAGVRVTHEIVRRAVVTRSPYYTYIEQNHEQNLSYLSTARFSQAIVARVCRMRIRGRAPRAQCPVALLLECSQECRAASRERGIN